MTEVDAHDQDDANSTEAAIAIAITEALAHPPDMSRMTADQAELIIEATVGQTLRFYAQRVLTNFIQSWRGTGPVQDRDYELMTNAVSRGVRRAIDDTGESVRDLARASARRADEARSSGPEGPYVVEEGLTSEAKAYQRLVTGMEGISRVLVTRTREEAKEEFATQVGAVGKAWRTRHDARVRTSHGDLEGDFVGINEPFVTISGAKLQRPGDPLAPLHETINCRCRLSYRMEVPA